MNRIARLLLVSALLFSLAGCGSYMKAEMKFSQNSYGDAIPLYKEYLAESPDNSNARSRLGFSYLKTNQIDNAISEFIHVLEKEPDEPFATLYLGMAYMNNQEFQKAIATWKGYTDIKQPLVEDEINRLLTILTIAESQKAAQKALAEEKSLQTSRVDPDTIAVGYFKDTSADKSLQAFQKGLAAMIISDLGKVKSLKVVERLRIQALLEEMKLGQTGIVDARTAPRVGKLLGAENMISG
ncbi:MAG: tetratricopeptide repeat protein, partial [Desulfobulbaceae bacterium]|nr:tetratricopeptide repeat protein [Desulfobulbaceae bacterium]